MTIKIILKSFPQKVVNSLVGFCFLLFVTILWPFKSVRIQFLQFIKDGTSPKNTGSFTGFFYLVNQLEPEVLVDIPGVSFKALLSIWVYIWWFWYEKEVRYIWK